MPRSRFYTVNVASALLWAPVHILPGVLFGSHTPFYYFESALLKLRESPLNPDHLSAIRHQNAQRLIS